MITRDMLPVLHLRRDAAADGWARFGRADGKTVSWQRTDPEGNGTGFVALHRPDRPGAPDFQPARLVVTTPVGLMTLEVSLDNAVRLLRAFEWRPRHRRPE